MYVSAILPCTVPSRVRTATKQFIIGLEAAFALCIIGTATPAVATTDPAAQSDVTSGWQSGMGLPGLNGAVYTTLVWDDGTGPMLYVAGSFSIAGDIFAQNIARWDGKSWHTLGSGTNGAVYALCPYGGRLVAAGSFVTAGGGTVNCVAAWDGASWQPLGSGMGGGTAPTTVSALAVWNGSLIAAGNFAAAAGVSASNVASWDGVGWHPLANGTQTNYALSIYNGQLVAGGVGLTTWDGTSWQPLGGAINGTVRALASYDDLLVAGGEFTTAGECTANGIVAWDGIAWRPLGSGMLKDTGQTGTVRAMMVINGSLIAAGSFAVAGGVSARSVAEWDGVTWRVLGSGVSGTVLTLSVYRGTLIAGGSFGYVGGMAANYIAGWDGSSWRALCDGLNGRVHGLTVYNGRLIAGGEFTTTTGSRGIGAYDGNSWQGFGSGVDGTVTSFVEYNGSLVVGGWFKNAGGAPADGIAAWDGRSWRGFGTRPPRSVLRGMAVYDGKLVINMTDLYWSQIFFWDDALWQPLGGEFGDETGPLAIYSDSLVVANGRSLFKWDGASWRPLEGYFGGSQFETSPMVSSLAVYNGSLIAGGPFTSVGGIPAAHIAAWDGTSWQPLGSGANGSQLTVLNDSLVAGGYYIYRGITISKISAWDGSSWRTLDNSGLQMWALTTYNGSLYAGGPFTTAGGKVSAYIARWSEGPPPRADFNSDRRVDETDFAAFRGCVTGPGMAYDPLHLPPECPLRPDDQNHIAADFNRDGFVDLEDYGIFQRCYSGTSAPVPGCDSVQN